MVESHPEVQTWSTHFDASGRVLVPLELRQQLHVETGTPMIWERGPHGVVLKRYEDVLADVQTHFRSIGDPNEVWSESLMRDRKAESHNE